MDSVCFIRFFPSLSNNSDPLLAFFYDIIRHFFLIFNFYQVYKELGYTWTWKQGEVKELRLYWKLTKYEVTRTVNCKVTLFSSDSIDKCSVQNGSFKSFDQEFMRYSSLSLWVMSIFNCSIQLSTFCFKNHGRIVKMKTRIWTISLTLKII